MHPGMMTHQPQQMHPDFYMMQQQQVNQQQRVPPVNMHMAPSQMQQVDLNDRDLSMQFSIEPCLTRTTASNMDNRLAQ
jgi:hypothetical protein